MAFVSPEYVKQMQLQHNAPHWRVTDRTKKLVINRNESSTLNTSIDQLQETLTNCVGDYVCVTLYTIKPEHLETGSKRGLTFDLMVKLNDPYINGNKSGSGSGGSGSGGPTFQDMLNLHARIQQYEIEKIKAEYEYNTEKKESAIDKLIGKLAEGDHINTLVSILMAKVNQPKQQISSPDQISGTSNIKATLSKLQQIDPDVENTLAAMANYLEKNPSVLPQIKSIIGA
jgi:hypothetical protein